MSETPSAPAEPEPEGPASRARAASAEGRSAPTAPGSAGPQGSKGGPARIPIPGPPPETPKSIDLSPGEPAPIRTATLWAALATGVLSMLLLGEGLAVNILVVTVPATLAVYVAGRRAGRRPRPWALVWGVGGVALLAVPALRAAEWPSFLAVVTALAAGSLALHGGRTWPAVLLGPVGVFTSLVTGPAWAWQGLRERVGDDRGRVVPLFRAVVVAAVLLLVFGALFAGADAAFADLLGALVPDVSVSDGPWQFLLLALGLFGTLAAARTAAAPARFDRVQVPAGRERGRVEWALPLVGLVALFAVFNAVQLAVLFGGYDAVLAKTGQTYAEYARQGFWQLLMATLLTLLVIVIALRWAPRTRSSDRTLVRGVLGTLCALALVVVASAVRRMDMYMEAYGLTRLRISVLTMELWLGLVIVLIMAAGVWGARWLPRAVAVSVVAVVLAFGLASPDALIAERNVQRYEATGRFDLPYARGLSADAVPALDRLEEPLRSCALWDIKEELDERHHVPWYATSWGEAEARRVLAERPPVPGSSGPACGESGAEFYR
ncbi:DUF4153 domain-containing protein [Streptomyces stelliscabiei]|uniref:MFS family permease n=1 Tax=Streptomyces stelliscabiei TaxID=146820 RepID=A0A8I0TWT6_9ACTN|nr:DUF4173 domain-containing protein [Streptomyces stelliscabiei]MBE1600698.1 MFS family permease [Streptomyces stelliscabiei]MDX2521771.1 DUF4173 domain-containing protein [Streptomyces stelliscabiei]MDX2554129.1 DUF4173 domain-containing protein [Streptomyces stelliscabiei]MDX2609807.1 DUF4173 domain-containing protein [Streptomyces stelliscabiei]MDX2638836.1 DUF4173 domain-containing protein [Streptomyces stelliscabiei]